MPTTTENKVTQLQDAAVDGRTLRKVRGPKGESTRVPWSGGLSPEELARPGGTLLSMLIHRANELGHQLGDMAYDLNVTYGYISQLRSGLRKTEHISDQFANACALYLGAPRMTVLLASGRVRPEDVFSDPTEMVSVLPRAIKFIQSDPKYGPLMPPDIINADQNLQYFIVTMFEDATGKTLLPGRANQVEIAKQIQKFNEIRNKLIAQTEQDRQRKAGSIEESAE
jgi:hypothetical protein